ncbi:sigma-70 family RNA polymerase sigma factor [Schlesneria paludicola]|uniref:sigma-70 family RNA polymerase sigma factor n=1 Tax=Schlesneria paludicola TaxID=360056 RepID=UPI00029A4B8D|nr:sigma-70 family RNA polymerase sigma factor [Schlesneria paludicola]
MVRSSSSSIDRQMSGCDQEARVARILMLEIEFIPSDEFESMLAAKTKTQKFEIDTPKRAPRRRVAPDGEHTSCLSSALSEPLLSFAEEQFEFRRMNYLKFVAARLQTSLNPRRPSITKVAEIERLLVEAKEVRDHIIRSNLRLVVSNAGKYRSPHYGFEDLVSDGSLALMEAVDKFDYQRGFRFSTYATHAIRRSFFRKIERRQRDRTRFVATDPSVLISTPDTFEELDLGATAQTRLIGRVVETLSEHLSDRERHIVEGRFGLNGRSEPRTLMELSSELGICKERVRQVEGLALRKLQSVAINYTHTDTELSEAAPV